MSTSGGVLLGGAPPSYGAASGVPYVPLRNVANGLPLRLEKTRAAISRSASGGNGDIVGIADSMGAGFNGIGNNQDTEQAFGAQLLNYLVTNLPGLVHGGDGVRPLSAGLSLATSGITFTGGVTNALGPWLYTTTGGTITRVGSKASTIVEICYQGQSNNFSFTVDGGGANNVVPSGLAQWEKFTLAGQPNIVHTVVITCGALFQGISTTTRQATGLRFHPLGYAGARLNSGTSGINWSNFASITNLAPPRLAALPAVVDTTVFEVGANDIGNGADPIATANGFANVMAQAPCLGSEPIIICTWSVAGTAVAAWNAFLAQCYAKLPTMPAVLVDWNDRLGGQALAAANGFLGPDSTHPTWATNGSLGKSFGDLLLG